MSYTFRRSFTKRTKNDDRRHEVVGNWLGSIPEGSEEHQMETFRRGSALEKRSQSFKGIIYIIINPIRIIVRLHAFYT